MPRIKLPTGEYATFPDDMSMSEIEAVLQKQFKDFSDVESGGSTDSRDPLDSAMAASRETMTDPAALGEGYLGETGPSTAMGVTAAAAAPYMAASAIANPAATAAALGGSWAGSEGGERIAKRGAKMLDASPATTDKAARYGSWIGAIGGGLGIGSLGRMGAGGMKGMVGEGLKRLLAAEAKTAAPAAATAAERAAVVRSATGATAPQAVIPSGSSGAASIPVPRPAPAVVRIDTGATAPQAVIPSGGTTSASVPASLAERAASTDVAAAEAPAARALKAFAEKSGVKPGGKLAEGTKAARIETGAERTGRAAGVTKEEVRSATGPVLGEAPGAASPILPEKALQGIIDKLKSLPKGGPEREAYVARATSGKTQWQVENIRRTLEHLGLLVPVAAAGAASTTSPAPEGGQRINP